MRLPKIDAPIFEINLISVKDPVKFRPFTVKEEKILLIAEEGNESNDILTAIKQVLNNCLITKLDVNKLLKIGPRFGFIARFVGREV